MDKKAPSEKNQEVDKIHDKLFWDIYSRPDNAAGFLRNFLPPNILKALDLNFLSVDKKSYLSEEYKEHYTDLVVKTRLKGNAEEPVFVYFLLEHKSQKGSHVHMRHNDGRVTVRISAKGF